MPSAITAGIQPEAQARAWNDTVIEDEPEHSQQEQPRQWRQLPIEQQLPCAHRNEPRPEQASNEPGRVDHRPTDMASDGTV